MKSPKLTINKSAENSSKEKSFPSIVKKYGSLIMYAEIVLIVLVGLMVFIYPKWQEVNSDTDGSLSYWQDKKVELEQYLVDAQKLVKLYNDLDKAQREKLSKILPNSQDIPALMSQLEALFATEELFLTSLGIIPHDDKLAESQIQTLGVDISFSAPADYYQFKQIMEKLESNVRLLNIKSFSYNPAITDINIQAEAYFINK